MQKYYLTAAVTVIALLAACAEAPQSEVSSSAALDAPNVTPSSHGQTPTPPEALTKKTALNQAPLPRPYQGLNPRDVSRTEIEELLALRKEQRELGKAYRDTLEIKYETGEVPRGDQPKRTLSPREMEIGFRLTDLNNKVTAAKLRKQYQNLNPNIISSAEIEELIIIKQKQYNYGHFHYREIQAWEKQDPSKRGAEPRLTQQDIEDDKLRMQALGTKIRSAQQYIGFTNQIKKLSKTHNMPLLDSEMAELSELYIESQQLQNEMQKSMMKARQISQANREDFSKATTADFVSKDKLQRLHHVQHRMDAIKYPLEVAEKAEKIRKQMTELSKKSGIAVLTSEIEETIALNSEKDGIIKKLERDTRIRQLNTGETLNWQQRQSLETEERTRLQEIEARIKKIYAPMRTAINAASSSEP